MKAQLVDDSLPNLFQGDCILPSQYNEVAGPRRYSDEGQRRLLLAVLEDAIRCYFEYSGAMRGTDRYDEFTEARDWIYWTGESEGLSFANVCEALGIDSSCLREGLRHRFNIITSRAPQAARDGATGHRGANVPPRLNLRERNGRMRVVAARR
ncbi:MAG TPA: hypothetical protein VMA09_08490 [Candidatus Binataceae bacterium]|nr:hypothetical protein [Candidatus Binataceae bacterium]